MTGWRLGWAQSTERIIRLMYKAVEFMTSNAAAMVQQAGIVALRDGEPYVHELRQHYARRRTEVVNALSSIPRVTLPEPQGAFYAFMQIDGMTDSAAFAAEVLRETGVALAPGAGFSRCGEGYIRLCFAARETTLADALARFRTFMSNRGDRHLPA